MGQVFKAGVIAVDSLAGGITIYCETEKDLYTTFEKPIGTKYQVPADTLLRIGLLYYSGSAVKTTIRLGYGDDSVNLSAVPPTNNVDLINQIPVEISNKLFSVSMIINIPTLKYPYLYTEIGDGILIAVGCEELT